MRAARAHIVVAVDSRDDRWIQVSGESRAAAFERVVLPHLQAAYTLARHLLGDDHDAQDVVQDAVLRAWRHYDGYDGGSARAWLLAIVRRACWSARAPRASDRTVAFDEATHSGEVGDAEQEREVDRAVTADSLRRAIDTLPAEFKEVLLLREVEGMRYAEIAAVVGVPVGTVMSRLNRARERLRAAYLLQDRTGK